MSSVPDVKLYADGSSKGNPGPGGYGCVLISGKHRKEHSQGYKLTTNNRMELLGVISGLEALKIFPCNVTVYSDSKYVVDAVKEKWLFDWEKKDFKKKKNQDLWIRFLNVYRMHNVEFVWVKGHSTNIENNRCDELAVKASENAEYLFDDFGYLPEE